MKKPSITPGEWVENHKWETQTSEVLAKNKGLPSIRICKSWSRANAKAILAVPKLIDGLMKAFLLLDDIPIEDRSSRESNLHQQFKTTLQDTGVEDL